MVHVDCYISIGYNVTLILSGSFFVIIILFGIGEERQIHAVLDIFQPVVVFNQSFIIILNSFHHVHFLGTAAGHLAIPTSMSSIAGANGMIIHVGPWGLSKGMIVGAVVLPVRVCKAEFPLVLSRME